MKRIGKITGKITANPNPVFFGQRCIISWETNDPIGAEIRVSTRPDDEKLVRRGKKSGRVEIPWIADSTVYEFRLYAASRSELALDSVTVRRQRESTTEALCRIADEVRRGNVKMNDLSEFIAAVLPVCLQSAEFPKLFHNWEQHGFHVTPVHFYQSIPDTRSLPEVLWNRPSELAGIDMNDSVQLELLRNHFPKFRSEYEQFLAGEAEDQNQFQFQNQFFAGTDALVAYCMVRQFQPRLIIEVGSGFSSLVLGRAATKNKSCPLMCIEPFPQQFLRDGFPGLQSLIEKKIQDIDPEFFAQLRSGDILFIDSSHTVKIGGDVNYLFFEVLPALKPGVIVHVHDIFLPFEYPRDWVLDELRFWTEQYLLRAFLSFNSEFEVLIANHYLAHYYLEDFKRTFPHSPWWSGGSFWMRRKALVDSGKNSRRRPSIS